MATKRYVFKREALTGGVNDTPFPDSRAQTQSKTQTNVRTTPEYTLEKTKGRDIHATATDVGGTVTDIMIPPKKTPLLTLNSSNNSLYFRFGAGPTYATATLATGDYYTYPSLAAALQAALNAAELAAGGGASNWTVTSVNSGNSNGGWLDINHASTNYAICWKHSLTTIDPEPFSNYWTVAFNAGVGYAGYRSLTYRRSFEKPCQGGNYRCYALSGSALYDDSKNSITYNAGSSYLFSDSRISGAWQNGKYYFSDGEDNYIFRFIRPQKQCPNGLISVRSASSSGAAANNHHLYYQQTDHATIGATLSNTCKWVRLRCREIINLGGNTRMTPVQVIDSISLWLGAAGGGDYDINIYHQYTYTGNIIIHYLDSLRTNEISTVAGGGQIDVTTNFTTYRDEWAITDGNYILLEFSPRTSTAGTVDVYGSVAAGSVATDYSWYQTSDLANSDAAWTAIDPGLNYWAWWGSVSTTLVATTGGVWKIRVALENFDGYITELGDEYEYTTPAATEGITLQLASEDSIELDDIISIYDIKDVIVYRTEEDGETFYEWFRIKCEDAVTGDVDYTSMYIRAAGMTDATLITQAAADTSTSRTTANPFNRCALWDNRLFTNIDGSDVLRFSGVNTPESFDLSQDWVRIGTDGSPITGLAAAGDRLIVFKEKSFHVVRPAGSSYGVDSLNDDGIGTMSHYSLVTDVSQGGTLVFFQGNDGRFYVTEGVNLTPLSGGSPEWSGRLEEFAKGSDAYSGATYQNLAALDKTVAFLNLKTREIVWSVCTGSNTTPDTNVVFNQNTKGFHFETNGAAYIWKSDNLTAGTPRYIGAYNTGTEDLVWYREDTADLDGNITATWETADLDFGQEEEPKHFISMYLSGYTTAPQYSIEGVTLTNNQPVSITMTAHPFVTGSKVYITGVVGTTELNGNYYTVTKTGANTFTLDGTLYLTASANYTAWVSDGTCQEYITVSWYKDGATAASGTKNIVLSSTPAKYRVNCPVRGLTIRYKITDTGKTGLWKINQLMIEYEPVRTVKKAT